MGRFYAWRAAIRLARRDAWRNKGRSALIAVMIAIPVLAASTVSVIYRSDQMDPQDVVATQLGGAAQAAITGAWQGPVQQSVDNSNGGSFSSASPSSDSPKRLTDQQVSALITSIVSRRDRITTDTTAYASRDLRMGDRLLEAQIREVDYSQAGLAGLIEQKEGRAPVANGEVVVNQSLARAKGIGVGDRLTYTGASKTSKVVTVVGVVGGAAVLGSSTVIARPGALLPASSGDGSADQFSRTWLVLGPDPVTWDQVLDLNQKGGSALSRAVIADPPPKSRVPYDAEDYGSSVDSQTVGVGIVTVALVLLQIALLAGPAIAVGARRNQRGLAIIASSGAERRHLRAVVLATSGLIGLVSSLVAAGLGAALGAAIVVVLRDRFDQVLVRVDVHPLDLLGLSLVGGLTAVGAALVPARQAARLDVVAALTGRRGMSVPRLRVPVVGLLVALVGTGLAVVFSGQQEPFLTSLGLALGEIGLVAAIGAVIALAARGAVRLPFAARFALRDAARQRGRTAPAVAAVMAAIAGGTAALVYVAAQSDHDRRAYQPATVAGVVSVGAGDDFAQYRGQVESALRRTLPVTSIAPVRALPNGIDTYSSIGIEGPPDNLCPEAGDDGLPPEATGRSMKQIQADPRCRADRSPRLGGPQINGLFDDGSVLAVVTGSNNAADTAALRAGQVVVFDPLEVWPDGSVHLTVMTSSSNGKDDSTKNVVLPAHLSTDPTGLMSPVFPLSAAKAFGVKPTLQGLVAATSRMPSSGAEDKAAAAVHDVAGADVSVERGYRDSYALGLLALVAASAVVTLAGTFTAVGLAAAEGRADVATLAAVGAGPGVRRRLAAAQAGVIAGLGSLLGVVSGVLAGWILIRMNGAKVSYQEGIYSGESVPASWHFVLPWHYLLLIALGMPTLAVVVGFLTTRSRLPIARRLAQ